MPRGVEVFGANAGITIDATEFRKLSESFHRLPDQMQRDVLARAFGRTKDVVERNYSQLAAKRMRIAQRHIKQRLRTTVGAGDITMRIKSTQIPLSELGAYQQKRGVGVRLRKSYRSAFIAKAKSGKGIVMKRLGAPSNPVGGRYPLTELYGPNPAHEALRADELYENMLGEIAQGVFFNEIARGVSYMLGRM